MNEPALERYRQRYETWRHLDGLRYRSLQMVVGAFGIVVATYDIAGVQPVLWVWLALSMFIFFQWRVLIKINDGIASNGTALRKFGAEVGDEMLPDTADRKNSIFYYAEWLLLVLAVVSFLVWLFLILDSSAP